MDGARYWCHMCSQSVNPIMEVESIKCPFCQSGFVEEIESSSAEQQQHHPQDFGGGSDSDRALSLWAPILLGMLSNPHRRRRQHRLELDNDDENDDEHNTSNNDSDRQRDTELDRELEAIIRRRRRSSATILQLLQGIRAGMLSAESENRENETRDRDTDGDNQNNSSSNNSTTNNRDRERERVILINPFNQTIIVQGSYDLNNNNTNSNNSNAQNTIGSLGDYFIGPGLDLLLQHLAENDPNRYGTPPAQKEAVEAMPTVKIEESLQCAVCLDDFGVGAEAKEMPCKHRFHDGCILPWLELHSSCPVCRYQLPSDESKLRSEMSRDGSSNNGSSGEEGDDDERNGSGRRFVVPLPWPFSTLFSPPGTQITNGNSSSNSLSSSSNAAESASGRADEN